MRSSTFKIDEKPVTNIHNSQIIDTIKTMKRGDSKLEVYKAKEKCILQSAVIVDPEIALDNKVKIGISKGDLSHAIKEKIDDDIVRIGYLEGLQYFEFKFKFGLLVTIKYCGVPD